MSMMEFMATVESADPEPRVRSRVVRFLTSRGYRPTKDPCEFKRGSLFGSLTGFSPKRWGVVVRFKTVEPGVYWFRFQIDTTGQMVVAKERQFWEEEKAALTQAIAGRAARTQDAS